MIWTIVSILFTLWVLSVISGNTFGGGAHMLLVLALIVIVIKIIVERRQFDKYREQI